MADTNSTRLDRIESKLDKLSDAIVTLARVEEKIADLEQRRLESHERVNRLSRNIDVVKDTIQRVEEQMKVVNKVMWFLIATGVTLIISHFLQQMG